MNTIKIRIIVRNKVSGAVTNLTVPYARHGDEDYVVVADGDVHETNRALQYALSSGYDGGAYPFAAGDSIHIEEVAGLRAA